MEEILKLIARTPLGRKLLERFVPLYSRKEVILKTYPNEILNQLRPLLPDGQTVGATWVENERVIYLDTQGPIGMLAPFLVHEIVHVLSNQKGTERELDAFETQTLFTQELKDRDPEYQNFLLANYSRIKLTDDWLAA